MWSDKNILLSESMTIQKKNFLHKDMISKPYFELKDTTVANDCNAPTVIEYKKTLSTQGYT